MAEDLNRFLINSMDRQSHLTVLAVLYDPRTGQAEFLNAGHPPIMISKPNGEVRELNFGQNPPLGVLPTSPSIDTELLQPGELLFLYTDGLTEMYDADGKCSAWRGSNRRSAGFIRPMRSFRCPNCAISFRRRLDEIRGHSPVTDDRTFLLAQAMKELVMVYSQTLGFFTGFGL